MPDPNRPLLAPEKLLDGWTPRRIGRRVLTLAETDSTNSVALAAAGDPDADGLAVFADYQTAGRGRQGRTWLAPRGAGILCSVLLRETLAPPQPSHSRTTPRVPNPLAPPSQTMAMAESGRLTLGSAVAVCEAIRQASDVTPAIKWPNDLRVSGRKLAGILIESRAIDPQTRAWVVGIGINCYQQQGHFPPELRTTATSLDLVSAHPVDRTCLARELLQVLDRTLGEEATDGLTSIYATWLSYAEPLGRPVRLRSNGREYAGRTVSVDPTGGLIVQCDDGRRQWFDPLFTTLL